MKKKRYSVKELSTFALFISLGLVLQYVEGFFVAISIPGGRIGLANIVSILNMFMFGGLNALVITTIRAFLGSLIAGGVTAIPYSVVGAIVSVMLMYICKRFFYPRLSIIGISIIGAIGHNVSQIFVASVFFSSGYLFSYLPPMLIVGLLGGMVTGYAAKYILRHYLKIML